MRYTQKDIRQKLGFTRDALRLYEKRGIIQPEIDPGNGYRYYDDWQMNLLWDCKYYQAMGFSLAEVQELLTARTPGDIESQLARREEEMRHDLRRRELALSEHSRFMEELRSSESDLGVVEERAAGMTVRPEDKEFIANFYKFAFVGLTLDWIKNDMRQDPAQLVEQLSTLIHGDVTKALEKCRIDKS